jgi:hypothetical protein
MSFFAPDELNPFQAPEAWIGTDLKFLDDTDITRY